MSNQEIRAVAYLEYGGGRRDFLSTRRPSASCERDAWAYQCWLFDRRGVAQGGGA